jgi:hypothetical protein
MFYSKEDIVDQIKTATVCMTLLKNGIIHYSYSLKTEITVENHWENHHALLKIACENKRHPLLIDSINFFNISNEVKTLVRNLEPEIPITGRAFVTDSLAERLLVRFFQRTQKTIYPLHIFSRYEEAVNWLLELK